MPPKRWGAERLHVGNAERTWLAQPTTRRQFRAFKNDGLLDSRKRLDDLRNRFSVLVGSRGDLANRVHIDTGRLACHVVNLAIGMPDGTREGKRHARLECWSWGTRDRHYITASLVQLSHACPLFGFGVVSPDRGLPFTDIDIAAARAAVTLSFVSLLFPFFFLLDLPLTLVEAVEREEICRFSRAQRPGRLAERHTSQ